MSLVANGGITTTYFKKPKGNALIVSIGINQYMLLANYRANPFKAIFYNSYVFSHFHNLPLIAFG